MMVTKVDGKSHDIEPVERRRIADHVLAHVSLGRSVTKIFQEDGDSERLCGPATWYRWLVNDKTLRDELASAREQGCERLVEEMIAISDDKEEDPQSRRVRCYARERAAQMLAPRRFVPKLDVTSGGQPLPAPAPTTVIVNRVEALLVLAQQRKVGGELLDVTPLDDDDEMRSLMS